MSFFKWLFGRGRQEEPEYVPSPGLHRDMVKMMMNRYFEIIGESIRIAATTRNGETRRSRVGVARDNLVSLRNCASKYPFFQLPNLDEIEREIDHIDPACASVSITIKEGDSARITLGIVSAKVERPQQPGPLRSDNADSLIGGYTFHANLSLSTPLAVLKRYGEVFQSGAGKHPDYDESPYGVWIPKAKSWDQMRIEANLEPLHIDIEETEMTCASVVGPALASELVPFLMEFRSIVERNAISPQEAIAEINRLSLRSEKFEHFMSRLRQNVEDFPASFFYSKFSEAPGIGMKTARALFEAGITDLEGLRSAIADGSVRSVPGVGARTVEKLRNHFFRHKA